MSYSAEILCVGTEILLGNIVNTNAAFLAEELANQGIDVYHQTVVGDNPQRLKDALDIAFSRNDIVITTGGLGPTYDDLTKETIAAYFGRKLVMHQPSYDALINSFQRWKKTITENNLKQAMMPEDAYVLTNPNGTAPGVILEGNGKIAIMLPGPPREMKAMFLNHVVAYLQKYSHSVLASHNVYFYGIGESALEAQLKTDMDMENLKNPTIAPYAKEGEVMLRVTASADSQEAADALMKPVLDQLLSKYPDLIYGVDVDNLQTATVQELISKNLKVAVAESCTGGYIAKRITDVPGSSKVFDCGITSYSNEMKEKILSVKPASIENFGVVSSQVAVEMAEGVRLLAGADIGLATTGIAGPAGGSKEKPLGLVYIAISSGWHNEILELNLSRGYENEREYIRYLASSRAIHLLLKTAQKYQ